MSGEGGPHVVYAWRTEAAAEIHLVRLRQVDDAGDDSDLSVGPTRRESTKLRLRCAAGPR